MAHQIMSERKIRKVKILLFLETRSGIREGNISDWENYKIISGYSY